MDSTRKYKNKPVSFLRGVFASTFRLTMSSVGIMHTKYDSKVWLSFKMEARQICRGRNMFVFPARGFLICHALKQAWRFQLRFLCCLSQMISSLCC